MTFLKPSGLSIDTTTARYHSQQKRKPHHLRNGKLASAANKKHQTSWGRLPAVEKKLVHNKSSFGTSNNNDAHFRRLLCEANILRRQHNVSGAIKIFRQLLQMKPGQLCLYIYLAKALENANRLDEAEAVLREAIFTNSDNSKAYDLMVDFCMTHGKLEEARILVEEALRLDYDNLQLHVKKCKILFELCQYDEVIHCSSKILRQYKDGKCIALKLLYVESVNESLLKTKVVGTCSPAYRVASSSSQMRQYQCDSYEAKQIESLSSSAPWNRHLSPQNTKSFSSSQACSSPTTTKRVKSLCKILEEIIELAPKNIRARVLLAELLSTHLNHHEEAYSVLQEALKLDPFSDDVQNALVDLMDIMEDYCGVDSCGSFSGRSPLSNSL